MRNSAITMMYLPLSPPDNFFFISIVLRWNFPLNLRRTQIVDSNAGGAARDGNDAASRRDATEGRSDAGSLTSRGDGVIDVPSFAPICRQMRRASEDAAPIARMERERCFR